MTYFVAGCAVVFVFAVGMLIKSFWDDERPPVVTYPSKDRPDVAEMCQQAETDDEMRMRVAEACLKSGKMMIGNMKPDGSWEVKEMDAPKF